MSNSRQKHIWEVPRLLALTPDNRFRYTVLRVRRSRHRIQARQRTCTNNHVKATCLCVWGLRRGPDNCTMMLERAPLVLRTETPRSNVTKKSRLQLSLFLVIFRQFKFFCIALCSCPLIGSGGGGAVRRVPVCGSSCHCRPIIEARLCAQSSHSHGLGNRDRGTGEGG